MPIMLPFIAGVTIVHLCSGSAVIVPPSYRIIATKFVFSLPVSLAMQNCCPLRQRGAILTVSCLLVGTLNLNSNLFWASIHSSDKFYSLASSSFVTKTVS